MGEKVKRKKRFWLRKMRYEDWIREVKPAVSTGKVREKNE
jgi:hypothetical protein